MKANKALILVLSPLVAIGAFLILRALDSSPEIDRADSRGGSSHQPTPSAHGSRDVQLDAAAASAEVAVGANERATLRDEGIPLPSMQAKEEEAAVLQELWDFQPGWNGETTDFGLQEQSSVYQPRGFRPVSYERLGLDGPPESRAEAYEIFVERVFPPGEHATRMIEGLALTTVFDPVLRRPGVTPEDRLAAESILARMRDVSAPLLAELSSIIQVEYDAQLRGTGIKLFRRGEMPPEVVATGPYALRDYAAIGDWYCALEFDPALDPSAAQILAKIEEARAERDAALAAILN